jgi:hypothetical protein
MYELFKWVWAQVGYETKYFDTEAEALDTKRIWGGEVFPAYRKIEDATTKK